jgi:DNA polymerase-1
VRVPSPADRSPAEPLLLVLDGNSLLHRAYHAAAVGRLEDKAGRPVWALHGLIGYAARAAALLRPDAVMIGFDCAQRSLRSAAYPSYKAHRPDPPADLAEQVSAAPGVLRATGLCTVVIEAYEADDVLASAAAQARRQGWRTVLATSDRDAFALIDDATSVLRIRNGGFGAAVLVTADTLPELCGVSAAQYRDFAALRGDPSDNLPGVRGFGETTAARLLGSYGSLDAAYAALDGPDRPALTAVIGAIAADQLDSAAGRDAVARNRRLMQMHTDLALPELDTARLPLSRPAMQRALAARGINLGPSLWALTGGPAPATEDDWAVVPASWVYKRNVRASRAPGPGQLALF